MWILLRNDCSSNDKAVKRSVTDYCSHKGQLHLKLVINVITVASLTVERETAIILVKYLQSALVKQV